MSDTENPVVPAAVPAETSPPKSAKTKDFPAKLSAKTADKPDKKSDGKDKASSKKVKEFDLVGHVVRLCANAAGDSLTCDVHNRKVGSKSFVLKGADAANTQALVALAVAAMTTGTKVRIKTSSTEPTQIATLELRRKS